VTQGAAVGLDRDRLTRFVYAHLAVYGFFLYGFGPSVTLLRDEQGVSRGLSGLHGTALAVGALVVGTFGARAVARFGRAAMLRAGVAGLSAGVVAFTATTALPVTLLGALVAGIAGSLIVTLHAPVLADRHGAAAPAVISEANAVASTSGMLAPAAMGVFVSVGIGWRPGLLLVLLPAAALLLAGRRVAVPEPGAGAPFAGADARAPGRLPRRYWAAWIVLVMLISVEFATTIWASELLRERVGLGDGAAAGSVTAVVAGMTVGRWAGSRLARRRLPDGLLASTLAVTLAGFAVLWLATAAWLAVVGLFVMGLGIALQFPLAIARGLRESQGRPDLAAARASLGAGLAIGLGPFVLGALADILGTHRAFLLVPALLGAAGTVLWHSRDGSTAPPTPLA
jgi:predicted MFS family arabinose efflux permease